MAQEICDNGIDDDGDGLIDCFDPDCSGEGSCSEFFFGNQVLCENDPSVQDFAIALQWASPNATVQSSSTVAIGDLDNDGIPEVVAPNHLTDRINVIDGQTGDWLFSRQLSYEPESTVTIGNIDDDDCGEIFVAERKGTTIQSLNCDLTVVNWTATSNLGRVGSLSLADFNQDGVAELYHANEILNASTGAIIVAGTGDWESESTYASIAVDILPDGACDDCSGLELVDGGWIYAIDIAAGTKTLVREMDDFLPQDGGTAERYIPKYFSAWDIQFSMTSVADYNEDGFMDVITSGAFGQDESDQTSVFMWDVANDSVAVYADVSNNHSRGTGRINIADLDNDGFLNASYVSDRTIYCLDENWELLWTKGISEGSSGFTGTSVFDFNGDGAAEVVYRSESTLHIIDGTDGSTNNSIYCQSRTYFEYPLVADVDGDGGSEIIVTCTTSDTQDFDPYDGSVNSQIRVYEAANGENWQPSRSVWNQHGYFNVNINDDLTVPRQQQDHTIVFSDGGCPDGTVVGEVRSLNSFLNQAPFLNADGCAEYSQPDFSIGDNVTFTAPTCPDTEFTIEFILSNVGDIDLNGTLPITFYAGDPTVSGSVKLNTIAQPLIDFDPGESLTITGSVIGPGGDFELYISINDIGSQNPPIDPEAQLAITECEVVNNLASISVVSEPFTLSVEKLTDNNLCDDSLPDNGSARAFYFGSIPATTEVAWLEDFEDLDDFDTEDTGSTAWSRVHSIADNSSRFSVVFNYFSGKQFVLNNTDEEVVWTTQTIDISSYESVDITADMLSDGALETSQDYLQMYYILDGGTPVLLNNGSQVGDFSYAQASADDLTGSTLVIQMRGNNTAGDEVYAIDNIRVEGIVPGVSGEFTDDYTFRWYNQNDFSTVLFTGSEYPNMADGTYNVVGFSNVGNCFSDTATVQIDRISVNPSVILYVSNEVTNCTPPNGELTAGAIDINDYDNDGLTTDTVTVGYDFKYYLGDFETEDDLIGTGPVIGNLEGVNYSVVVTDLNSGCSILRTIPVTSSLAVPSIAFDSKTDVTSCANLSSGSATVSSLDDVTFSWYDGGSIKATPDFTGSTYNNIPAGDYLVIARDNISGCPSDPLVITIDDLTNSPVAVANTNNPNTSCENNTGSATATGMTGSNPAGVTGYDFEWYAGLFTSEVANNRLPAAINGVQISADGATAKNGPGGFYTVVVTETATGCFGIDTVEIVNDFSLPEFTFQTPINTGDAVVLEGKGYIELPQTLAGLNSFTVSYWADFTPDNYSDDERTFSSGATGENQVLLWSDNHDGLAFVVRTDNGQRGRINSAYSATGWTQVVGTYDGTTGDMVMYANGVQIGVTNFNGSAVIDTGNPMYIGRDNNLNSKKFEGTLDEVRIYGVALSPEEVVEQMCRELTGTETGLIAYYNFNNIAGDTDGTIVPDESGNGNNGILREPNLAAVVSTTVADIECPISSVDANTSCDASNPNGIIDAASEISPPGNYFYRLYEGFSTANRIDSTNTGVFTGLGGGFYTLTATDVVTGCITRPSIISIPNIPDNPNIFTSIVDDRGCISTGTGEILVTASSNTVRGGSVVEPTSLGYTFELFDGANTTNNLFTEQVLDGSTGFNFTGLTDGVYRIRVTNNELTCFSLLDVTVGNNSTLPTISNAFPSPNNSCDPANPSGQVTVQFAGDPADFEVRWYTGDVVDEANRLVGESGTSINDLAAGNYTVIIVDNETGCISLPSTETVVNQPLFPDITIVTEENVSNCVGQNGSLRAFVTEASNPGAELDDDDGYSFQWYMGNTITPGNEVSNANGGNTSTIVNQVAGEYIVEVTFTSFDCKNSETAIILNEIVLPVLTLSNSTTTENTKCDPGSGNYDGTATVNSLSFDGTTINLPNADYSFIWYEGSDVTGTLLAETSNVLSQREDGNYTVVAVNTSTGCESSPITLTIDPDFTFPDVTLIDSDDNIVCDPSLTPTGQITIRPTTGNITDYNFTWFNGQTTDPTENVLDDGASVASTSTDNIVSNIAGGTYRVEITNVNTGCSTTRDFTIIDTPTTPEIDGANSEVNNNTICSSPGNGSVIAALDLLGIEINGVDNDVIWQNVSSCNTVVFDDATTFGTNGFQLTTDINDQFGRIWLGDTLDIAQPLRFDFELYLGDEDVDGADGIALTFHRDPRGYDARGRVGGDLGVGETQSFGSFNKIEPSITIEFDTWQNNDLGDPAFDHTTLFFNGNVDSPEITPVRIADGQDNVENGDSLNVSVIIRQVGGQQNLQVWVDENMRFEYTGDIVNSVFGGSSDIIAGFTSSTGGSDNNQAVRITPFFDRFEFDWYDGSSVDPANIRSEKDPFLCGLSEGQYTLVVTDNTTGCVSVPFTYQVDDDGAIPAFDLDAVNSNNNGVCDPSLATTTDNGQITITPEDGSDVTDYSYEWYDGNSTAAPLIASATTNVLDEIDGGTYTVRVTNINSTCDEVFQFTIIDEVTAPEIPVAAATPVDETICAGGTGYPNGGISVTEASVTGGGPYTYRYYIGTSVDPLKLIDDNSNIFDQIDGSVVTGVDVSGSSTATISGLVAGDYTVVAISDATGCISDPVTVTIGEDPVDPPFAVSTSGGNTRDNSVCSTTIPSGTIPFNGQITVLPTGSQDINDYSYQWYEGSGNGGTPITDTDNILNNVQGGTYTVEVTDNTTNCSVLIEHTINDVFTNPDIPVASVQPVDVSLCNGGTGYPNGGITVDLTTIPGFA
ncbi:MAG: LamG-like jellyroll fold domain-containing protein, partial [Cyclobacteriaceae bacterium]